MTKYSELLRDPRWQRKRLEILNRDSFTCRRCKATDRTLNVHHCYYVRGHDPWDYPDGSLVTLCEPCHEHETENGPAARQHFQAVTAGRGGLSDWLDAMATALEDENVYDAVTLAVWWHRAGLDTAALAQQIFAAYSAATAPRPDEAVRG